MKKSATQLTKTLQTMVEKTFNATNVKNGTMGQCQQICYYTRKRDGYLQFYNGVKEALANTPKGYRALITHVYLKNADKQLLCQRYKLSLSTLYRYLSKARKCFKCQLILLGMDEKWLVENYSTLPWVEEMISRDCRGRSSC